MYFADTPEKKILAYAYTPECTELNNPRCVYRGHGLLSFPDGATVDPKGYIWSAIWGGSAVIRIDPDSGTIDTKIELPVKNPTCVVFGGDKFETLFITSSRLDMTEQELLAMPLAGGLFSVDVAYTDVRL